MPDSRKIPIFESPEAQANSMASFLHFETAKFLNEVANDPSVGLSSSSLWTSLGRYTYSTFASQIFGMEVGFFSRDQIST